MVKFNIILALAAVTSVSAFNSPIDGFYETGECRDLNIYLNRRNVELYKCEMNDNNDITRLIIGRVEGELQQDIIDTIGRTEALESLEFLNIPESVDLSDFHINELIFTNDNNLPSEYKDYTLPAGILKTAKNVDKIVINSYPLDQNLLNEISSLTSLKDLELSDCDFGKDGKSLNFSKFKKLTQLTSLHLSTYHYDRTARGGELVEGQAFKGFPEAFCNLKKLKELELYYGKISSIPSCIGQLRNLEKFALPNSQLSGLPKEFGKLTKLKYLSLYNNKITFLPNEFANLTQLRELDLTGNKIKSVSSAIGKFKKLESLRIESNRISSIPSSITNLTNLKELDMSSNKIKTIPDAIGKLKKLEKLSLVFNAITNIPEQLGQLKNLQELYLYGNKIDAVIPKSLNNLTNLKYFHIYDNVDIRGETLTMSSLEYCSYNSESNKTKNGICLAKNSKCIPNEEIAAC